MKRWKTMAAGAVLLGGVATGAAFWSPGGAEALEISVYRSPSCGCCGKWIDHLQDNGFQVTTHDVDDLTPIKRTLGVTPELASCHTARVDGYVVEGHVPADSIKRLLAQKPDVQGLAVPGMPMGSPGMEGPYSEPYKVLTFDTGGATAVYERH